MTHNILLIGSGGREHALAWTLAKSPLMGAFYAAPGNPGIAAHAACVDLDTADHSAVINFCKNRNIDAVIIGPEGPLVNGLADDLSQHNIRAFGPCRAAAQLEGSKAFTKQLCRDAGIPTAAHATFDDAHSARAYLARRAPPFVIKADGIAAGKGVTICYDLAHAHAALDDCFNGVFGSAGARVVIEDFLEGPEVSFFVLSDGRTVAPFTSAQDHKRAGEGDTGPNTGGMGAYSPSPLLTQSLQAEVMARIITPTFNALRARGILYTGVLYAGLMLTRQGPQLIEYNCRFGDPETQAMLPRLRSDLLALLLSCTNETLDPHAVQWRDEAALSVVYAARGYPGAFEKGSILDVPASLPPHALLFHAGTKMQDGKLVAAGGRVLNVTGRGVTLNDARRAAYDAIQRIDWPGGFFRRDIGGAI